MFDASCVKAIQCEFNSPSPPLLPQSTIPPSPSFFTVDVGAGATSSSCKPGAGNANATSELATVIAVDLRVRTLNKTDVGFNHC
jgi:hypothetical protein